MADPASVAPDTAGAAYLADVQAQILQLKKTADRAIAQISDQAFFAALDRETNSVALTVKHLGGNLRSRWTDFVTADGEKPDRHRDREFILEDGDTRASLLERWDDGWCRFVDSVAALAPAQLTTTVLIRSEPHSVVRAIQRSLTHVAYHVGQIVLLARHHCGDAWTSLSVPRGQSEAFNAKMRRRFECGGPASGTTGA